MKETIYIDGECMDLASGKVNVQLIYQSPILLDFQQIVSNRTTQVSLPATTHNLRAIGYTGTQAESDFGYRYHTVIYKRDGLQLLKGNATLLSIGKGKITMCFTWGNVTAMKSLFDTKLRDLENTPYCSYPPTAQGDDPYRSGLNYGGDRWGVCCNAQDILTAIQTQCGVSGLMPLCFQQGDGMDGYMFNLSLTTRNGNLTTRYLQGIKFGMVGAKTITTAGTLYAHTLMTKGANSTDPHSYMDSDGYIDVQDAEKVRVHLKGKFTMVKRVTTDLGHDMTLVGYDNNTGTYTLIDTLCTASVSGSGSTKTMEYDFNVDATYDVTAYTHLVIELFYDATDFQPDSVTTTSLTERYIVPDPHLDDEVIYAGVESAYPVYYNLPDITCGQLIKNLLWLRGEFAYSRDGQTFSFISFNQLQTNKANAVDWTKKMKGEVQEFKTTLGDTAQRNLFRYAEADWYDHTQYQGVLPTDDETIDAEREYCKSDFALAPEQKIPAWVEDGDGEWQYEGDSFPAIMMLSRVINNIIYQPGYWDVQRFQNLLNTYYQQYAEIILRPVQIKATVILTTLDLYMLDLTVPVYLKQTGHYYLIRKMSVKGASEAEVELIKI